MSQTIDLALASLVSGQSSGYVVEDIYVKGGYRVVTVGQQTWADANGNADDQLYQSELADAAVSGTDGSLKVGCLVFDTTSSRNFRCTGLDPVTFIEAFANNGDVDTTAFVQRSELPQDANGAIDIASEATLQEALLSSVRVSTDGQQTTNLSVTTAEVPGNTTDALILNATSAVPATNTAATVTITLNPNAIGGDAASA